MPESDLHRMAMLDFIEYLRGWYHHDPMTYVSGDLLLYYEEGNPRKCISPDCFVVFGVPNKLRESYLLWDEGKAPQVVFEIISKTSRKRDIETKRTLYQDRLRIAEYFIFDPGEERMRPSLQGFRLVEGVYQPIEPNFEGRMVSEQLNLELLRDGYYLRVWDPVTRQRVPTTSERLIQSERENERLRGELEQARRSS